MVRVRLRYHQYFWEIFNTGRVVNKTIDVEVPIIFRAHLIVTPFPKQTNNDDENTSDLLYPMIGYSAHSKPKLEFSAMFGVSRRHNGPIGSYFYYYKDTDSLIQNENNNLNTNIGCVRYVLYADKLISGLDHRLIDGQVIADMNIYLVTNYVELASPISHHLL